MQPVSYNKNKNIKKWLISERVERTIVSDDSRESLPNKDIINDIKYNKVEYFNKDSH